jgi:II/X family phage/plasmid replication protein
MTTTFLDWFKGRLPCYHPELIDGGRVLKVLPDGTKEWEIAAPLAVIGSHDSSIRIRSYGIEPGGPGTVLEIDGNPTKWLQGHNVFGGFTTPAAMVAAFMPILCHLLPDLLQPTVEDRRRWVAGEFQVARADVTRMLELPSRADVRCWLRSAEHCAYMKHRGRGTLTKNGTLYIGQHSRRWALKFYSKGDELDSGKGHGLHDDLEFQQQLRGFADNKLRMELVLRAMELKRRGLDFAANWLDTTGAELLNAICEGLTMSDMVSLPTAALENLKPRLVAVYHLWREGHDLRAMYPSKTFYRYRGQLLPLGVDISIRQPHEDRSNVVPLVRVLEAIPCGPPEWARGTSLLAEPGNVIPFHRRAA